MAEVNAPVHEGPGKGQAFFKHARTVADSGNYDYAITLFVEGLNREPENIEQHEALRKVSLERRVKGGKPAGGLFGPKPPLAGKTPKEKMLNAEWILAKDPGNITVMLQFMRAAAQGGYAEVIKWFGPTLMLANKKTPKKEIYLELAEWYEGLKEYRLAADAVQQAAELDPTNQELQARLRELSALDTMDKGKYGEAESFKESIKDTEKTKELLQEESLQKNRDYLVKQIEQARAEYEANPTSHPQIVKYVRALTALDEENFENQAIEILEKAYGQTQTYQYKRTIDEIKIRQFRRHVRMLADMVKTNPNDRQLAEDLAEVRKEQLAFELAAFRDWAAHYPTDMQIQFDLGFRLYQNKQYDLAIEAFQLAQSNPKHRVDAVHLLGRSFMEQRMLPEAVETLKRAVDEYEMAETGNQKAKELYYWLARCYEEVGQKADATAIYSKITQWDIGYRDARARLNALRAG